MKQMKLNEAQMREYVEKEVRNALLAEGIDENGLTTILGGLIGNGAKMPSLEAIIGAVVGNKLVAPILERLLNVIGIPANGPIGKFIVETAVSAGGAKLGDWIDQTSDPIGLDNIFKDKSIPAQK